MKWLSAILVPVLLVTLITVLTAFSAPGVPSRHPGLVTDLANDFIYMHDPTGIPPPGPVAKILSSNSYCGATSNTVLVYDRTNKAITCAADQLLFNTAASTPAQAAGLLFYCAGEDQTLCYYNDEVDVTMNVGQESWIRVYNATGSTIANGAPVYINGRDVTSGLPTVALADADTAATAEFAGLATHSIENATKGYITGFGNVNTFDTSGLTGGAPVYVSGTAGTLTSTVPASPAFKVLVGYCVRSDASAGKVFVQPGVRYTTEGTSAPTGSVSVDFLGLVAEGANGQGAFYATGTGTTPSKFRNIVCTCRVAGTAGTNGIFAEIFAGGVAGSNCELAGADSDACNDAAGTVIKCDINTSIVASTNYTLQIKSTTDCGANPTDCNCNMVIER